MDIGSILITTAILVYILIVIGYIVTIIISYDNCNPLKTIGWIFAVIVLPVIGILMYTIVGRNLNKKRSYFNRLSKEVRKQGKPNYKFEKETSDALAEKYSRLQQMLTEPFRLPLFTGNNIELFSNGKDKFDNLFRDIEEAKEHIHIYYYTIGDDEVGNRLKYLLIAKRRQGLEVRLMYDDVGSNKAPKAFFDEMKNEGIEIITFSPVRFPRLLKSLNYRNHKKIVVIDGLIGYTGGMNVKDEYVKGLEWGEWRDVHLRITGSGTQGLQTIFLIDWFYESNEYLLNDDRYYPAVSDYGLTSLQVVTAEPIGEFAHIMLGMCQAIMNARRSVYIESPYFVPSDSILTAIQTAALCGVDVHLVIPKKSDNKLVQYATNSYVQQLLTANVKVYQYSEGFIHSKLIVVDDELTIAGSSNMDIRSFELNFEANVFIYDRETARNAKRIVLEDIAGSQSVNLEEWMQRSKFSHFVESFFRLFSPLM